MPNPLRPIMLVRPPNAILHEESFWDELAAAGIREVALQWLCLLDDRGPDAGNIYPQPEDGHPRGLAAMGGERVKRVPTAAYKPNPELYAGLDWSPPDMPDHLTTQQEQLRAALQLGIRKGFRIYTTDDKGYFLHGSFGTGKLNEEAAKRTPSVTDKQGPAMTVARTRDTIANFPEISGLLLDGPDFKWEIKPGHRDDLWVEPIDTDANREFAASNEIDFNYVLDGRSRFQDFLRSFKPDMARDFIEHQHGALAEHAWWSLHPEFSAWYAFKQKAVEWSLSSSYNGVKKYLPDVAIGSSSRLPFLGPLTGHNPTRKQRYANFQMPKEYWWSGGVAGFRGTIVNWVETLMEWNPGLDEELATQLFSAMFDYPMPSDYPVSKYSEEATDEWFATSVRDQTKKMLDGAGDADRFVPWVGLEHFGSNWLTPSELDRLLLEMQKAGAERYCYFVYNSLKPEYWDVIRKHTAS
jgi:hypothetical protein